MMQLLSVVAHEEFKQMIEKYFGKDGALIYDLEVDFLKQQKRI